MGSAVLLGRLHAPGRVEMKMSLCSSPSVQPTAVSAAIKNAPRTNTNDHQKIFRVQFIGWRAEILKTEVVTAGCCRAS